MTGAREQFDLDPGAVHLNHGSFGAVPRVVLAEQAELRRRMDGNYHRFFDEGLFGRLEESRLAVAAWLGADPAGFVQTTNVTASVWTALTALDLRAGDRVVTSAREYGATRNMLVALEERGVVVDRVGGTDEPATFADRFLARVDGATRCVLVSHVTSPWTEVLPVRELHDALAGSPVELVVDGAHAVGLLALDLAALPSAWYAMTLHKWGCFPRGSGALVVPAARRTSTWAVPVSLGGGTLPERFAWTGTQDPTPHLMGPSMVRFHAEAAAAGWPADTERLAAEARALLDPLPGVRRTSAEVPTRMTTYELELGRTADQLQAALRGEGIWTWLEPDPLDADRVLMRVSIAPYNQRADVEALAAALGRLA